MVAATSTCAYIRRLPHLSAVVVTHLDQDHIAGALSLARTMTQKRGTLAAGNAPLFANRDEWYFNHPDGLWADFNAAREAGTGVGDAARYRSVAEGNTLLYWAHSKPLPAARSDTTPLFDEQANAQWRVRVWVVTPKHDNAVLVKLNEGWSTAHAEESTKVPYAEKKTTTGAKDSNNKSCRITHSNIACVSLLIEFKCTQAHDAVAVGEVRRALLTGDAPQDLILDGLLELDKLNAHGKLHLDYLHVPHHGSSKNADANFFQTVTADVYNVTGNGRTFGDVQLPQQEVIDHIVANAPADADGRCASQLLLSYKNAHLDDPLHAQLPDEQAHRIMPNDDRGCSHYAAVNLMTRTVTVNANDE